MKVRVISALVAIAILVPFLVMGGIPFAIIVGALSVWAYKEVLDLKKTHNEIPDAVKVCGLFALLYLVLGNYGINSLDFAVSYSRIILPLILLLIPTVFYKKDKYTTKDAFHLLGLVYLLGMIFNLIIVIRNINVYLLLYLLCVTVFTDTFAYLIGYLIGRHKMAPTISPKKSWEGAIAGLIGGTAIATIFYSNLVGDFSIKVLIITMILSVVGQLGDLVFSKIKRENEIKDFSNIMPGHGGVLDRLDSLSFVIFVYVVIIWFI
ncbi:MAG: phosphatidate cytidylyltransferase [Bacilli bacterium]|nr:phosphatidate cytidylyltransferase [Bacilli bacterium]